MIDRNAQVGWTDAQWNRVRQAVAEEWQKVRVAGSVLPTYGPLPPSTEVVPSELVLGGGGIDDAATARIVELFAPIELSGQQVSEEELSDAVLLFRRAATALARIEDQVIFNGQFVVGDGPSIGGGLIPRGIVQQQARFPTVLKVSGEPELRQPNASRPLSDVLADGLSQVQNRGDEIPAFATFNPGALGLVVCAGFGRSGLRLSGPDLVSNIGEAIAGLESLGYGAPFVCFLGQNPYVKAHEPTGDSMVLPADRIEPLIGRDLVRAPALDFPPPPDAHRGRGVVLSLAGDSVDLVMAVQATPQFTHVTDTGKYSFRVYERFTLRVKDNSAIVLLDFTQPPERRREEKLEVTLDEMSNTVKQIVETTSRIAAATETMAQRRPPGI